MLAGLIGIVVAAGLLSSGVEGPWTLSSLVLVLLSGTAAWICGQASLGWLPSPEPRLSIWAAALAVISLSVFLLPLSPLERSSWTAAAAGLSFFPLVSVIDVERRERLEQIVRIAAWMLVLMAAFKGMSGGLHPHSIVWDKNAFAAAILLLLPFAVEAGKGFLVVGLLLCLWSARSVGAWLGLSAALLLHKRAVGAAAYWFGAVAGFISLIAVYAKLQSPEVIERLEWWREFYRFIVAAPWLGLGLGLWLAGLVFFLKPGTASRRFGPIAVLIYGLVDYPLSSPAVFWLFCVSTALAVPASGRSFNIPSRHRPLLCAIFVALSGVAGFMVWRQ